MCGIWPTLRSAPETHLLEFDAQRVLVSGFQLHMHFRNAPHPWARVRHRDQAIETEFEAEDQQFSGAVAVSEVNGPDIKSENGFDKITVKTVKLSVTANGTASRPTHIPC
jgi:hypothetical protein